MKTWYLSITQPAPSMQEDVYEIRASSYADAVAQCYRAWQKTRQNVTLHDNKHCVYYWHRIARNGERFERNTRA